jgi:hypothetical protein
VVVALQVEDLAQRGATALGIRPSKSTAAYEVPHNQIDQNSIYD